MRPRTLNCHGLKRLLIVTPIKVETAHHKFPPLQRMHHSDGDDLVGVSVRKAAKEDAVYDAEDTGGGADAQRKRRDHCDREYRIATKAAQGIAHIAQQALKPWERGALAVGLPGLLRAAKTDKGLTACFFLAKAFADAMLNVKGDVGFEFGIEIAVVPQMQKTRQSTDQRSEFGHLLLLIRAQSLHGIDSGSAARGNP